MEQNTNLKEGSPYKDVLVARHLNQMWLNTKIPADSIQLNWKVILQLINYARRDPTQVGDLFHDYIAIGENDD